MNSILRLAFLLICILPGLFLIPLSSLPQDYRRWQMNQDGSITWTVKNPEAHDDHIEMSGKQISAVLRYGVGVDGSFHAARSLVWPMFRTIPNNTHASLTGVLPQDGFETVLINGKPIAGEKVKNITLNEYYRCKAKPTTDLN